LDDGVFIYLGAKFSRMMLCEYVKFPIPFLEERNIIEVDAIW